MDDPVLCAYPGHFSVVDCAQKRGIVMDYGKLPYTGAGLMIGSFAIGFQWVALVAALMVVFGVVLIRFGWRRGKAVNDA